MTSHRSIKERRRYSSKAARAGWVGLSSGLLVALWAGPARAADTVVGGDLAWATPSSAPEVGGGWGGDVRVGRRLNGEIIVLAGEVEGGYYTFGGALSPSVYRGMAGARLGVGALLRPFAFAHAGVGRGTFASPPGTALSRTGLTYDAGGGIDFTLLPVLNIGVYGAYNFLAGKSGADSLKWATLGVNVELIF